MVLPARHQAARVDRNCRYRSWLGRGGREKAYSCLLELYGKLAAEMTLESASAPIPAWWVRAISRLQLSALHALSRLFAVLALKVFPYRPRVIDAEFGAGIPGIGRFRPRAHQADFYVGMAM